ncbi:hypothetical protein CL3_19250 [butyrate-producing bacterium SM4/1]|nr:hypothetical protein CL3_19250 [butyrate-producing bacterium SM4/1]
MIKETVHRQCCATQGEPEKGLRSRQPCRQAVFGGNAWGWERLRRQKGW